MILELIKHYRKVYKLTQKDAAQLLNVSRKRYLSLESGKMTIEQAEVILKHLNKALLIVEMSQIRVQNNNLSRDKQGQNTPSAAQKHKPKPSIKTTTPPPEIDTTDLDSF